jgi:phosphoglycolate phosphatase
MTLPRIIVFDLDGTLVDTAPDLIAALNFVLDREGLPPVPLKSARNMIGAGARKLIERGLELEGRTMATHDVSRLTKGFHRLLCRPHCGCLAAVRWLETALDDLEAQGFRFAVCTNKLEWLSKLLLDKLDLSRRFAAICGADTFGFPSRIPPSCAKRSSAPADSCPAPSWSATPVPTSASPGGRASRLSGSNSDTPMFPSPNLVRTG